jgi:hypothetical protein
MTRIIDNGASLYRGVRYTATDEDWDIGDPVGMGDTPAEAALDLARHLHEREEERRARSHTAGPKSPRFEDVLEFFRSQGVVK